VNLDVFIGGYVDSKRKTNPLGLVVFAWEFIVCSFLRSHVQFSLCLHIQ